MSAIKNGTGTLNPSGNVIFRNYGVSESGDE